MVVKRRSLKIEPPDIFSKFVEAEVGCHVTRELAFHPTRNWRFDYAIEQYKVAIEVDGGVWNYGRHNSAQGYIHDLEKLNSAAELGWIVIRITPQQRFSARTIEYVKGAIEHQKLK